VLGLAACEGVGRSADAGLDATTLEDATIALDAAGPDAGPVLELGTGLEGFEPLGTPAEVELVHGPQGGYHLTMAMRAWQLVPVALRWQVYRVDDARLLADLPLDARPGSFVPTGGALVRAGELVILDVLGPTEIVDREVRIDANVRAATGEMAARSVTVRVVDREP
jgi:hypothetical protein